jgi:hypothetical protein
MADAEGLALARMAAVDPDDVAEAIEWALREADTTSSPTASDGAGAGDTCTRTKPPVRSSKSCEASPSARFAGKAADPRAGEEDSLIAQGIWPSERREDTGTSIAYTGGQERCESGRIGLTANELTWETGSEGSNPSLSATPMTPSAPQGNLFESILLKMTHRDEGGHR